jgi:hypothetical protein
MLRLSQRLRQGCRGRVVDKRSAEPVGRLEKSAAKRHALPSCGRCIISVWRFILLSWIPSYTYAYFPNAMPGGCRPDQFRERIAQAASLRLLTR